tara:strand:+ start:425 stop:730 length:306 start_codon:yes stop_codon:yes gene_type:complete
MIIGIGLIVAIIMGILGRYVAKEKNRSGAEGFWLGFLFSIFGVILVALLPTKEKKIIPELEISEERQKEIHRHFQKGYRNMVLGFSLFVLLLIVLRYLGVY